MAIIIIIMNIVWDFDVENKVIKLTNNLSNPKIESSIHPWLTGEYDFEIRNDSILIDRGYLIPSRIFKHEMIFIVLIIMMLLMA